jgi:hypothetical protein
MRRKLARLMQYLKAANARLDRRLQAIEEKMLQLGEPEAASVRQVRVNLATITEMLPGHVNGADAAED